MILQAGGRQNKEGVDTLTSKEIDFMPREVTRHKYRYFMIKGVILKNIESVQLSHSTLSDYL